MSKLPGADSELGREGSWQACHWKNGAEHRVSHPQRELGHARPHCARQCRQWGQSVDRLIILGSGAESRKKAQEDGIYRRQVNYRLLFKLSPAFQSDKVPMFRGPCGDQHVEPGTFLWLGEKGS